jgi:hypothetical protein
MLAQAAFGVGRPAAIEAAVGTAEQVDVRRHSGDFDARP